MDDEDKQKLLEFIVNPDLSLDDIKSCVVPRECDESRLLSFPNYSSSYKYVPSRHYLSGEVKEYIEVEVDNVGASARNSMSMRREPGLPEEVTKGSHMYYPFWPGGFDEPVRDGNTDSFSNSDFEEDLLSTPPGFDKGYDFSNDEKFNDVARSPTFEDFQDKINLLNNLETDADVQEWLKLVDSTTAVTAVKVKSLLNENPELDSELLTEATPPPVLNITDTTNTANFRSEWAEMLDTSKPIDDFHERLPNPAVTFPFELDIFQKQAILKLEDRQYVFVAAHTSAGKTVVAEYAIGLSQRDLTRTIYTSPIKALSNQKYRDFKKTFRNVGLITGDLQIDPQESILIMTTEILRSMLYCGSDITRDLEYVIFDEVHYINNPERGHVWEEVIILLPDHVNIIMLSATVPNTMELADWVGSTKKRKVFVISTQKRPVPLMHYLYTGAGGKSKDDIFLLVDSHGKFLQQNYENAVKRKDEMENKSKCMVKNRTYANPKDDKKMWIGLIDFLKRNNKMPVVAFTLSRNRCDINSQALQSVDLNTAPEKESVQSFFQQCLNKLKPPDRILPQVLTMKNSLERGIGVHHSGILPILKEIVEMLFASGLVKLLFATETFAMGVNMPARTVIFDSHRKFDGMEVRNLKPGEYIQMAGRAGRRGHDENGTVIMICKQTVPPSMELRAMILGQPEKLRSQFILRYAVILTCLRIESIKVEDIMQFTFLEFNAKLQIPTQQKQLKVAEEKYSQLPEVTEKAKPLCDFYDLTLEYITTRAPIMKYLLSQTRILKELKPGRVLIVTKGKYINRLGILLTHKASLTKDVIYRILVLDDQHKNEKSTDTIDRGEMFYKMLSLTNYKKYFVPEGICGHTILDCKADEIVEISKAFIKVDADSIIRNWEQRQIQRFKDSPPGPSVVKAVSELSDFNNEYMENSEKLKFLNLLKDVPVSADTEISKIKHVNKLWRQINDTHSVFNVPHFDEIFAPVYDRRILELKIEELKFKNSSQNLSLYADYRSKLAVLRSFNYIDHLDEVTLKGKVACEMGQNELLITELILCNTFNDLEPAEISALLSGLVFRAKVQGEPVIPGKLVKVVENIKEIDERILAEELRQHAAIETDSRLNFGLLEVVYEWARNKPFAEIMKLTEVQEGIIVRCIQQLDETLRDVKTAAKRIGNPTLENKMEEASNAIKRDIVFTASLYTTV